MTDWRLFWRIHDADCRDAKMRFSGSDTGSYNCNVRSIARYREWMVRDLVIDIEAHSCIVGRVIKKPVLVPFPAAAMRASEFFCLCSCVRRQPWAAFKLVVKAALIDERAIDYFVNDRLLAFDEYGPDSRLRRVTA